MIEKQGRPALKLIRSPRRQRITPEQFSAPGSQALLFPLPQQDLLIFLLFPAVTEEEFTPVLEYAKPTIILELRRSPRFDIGGLTRQDAFKQFKKITRSILTYRLGLDPQQAKNGTTVALIDTFLQPLKHPRHGPVMILLNEQRRPVDVAAEITQRFTAVSNSEWRTYEIPQFA
jgi:hypothetical protein